MDFVVFDDLFFFASMFVDGFLLDGWGV